MDFDAYVYARLVKFPNKEEIFGKQQIYDADDQVCGTEPNLLINATEISFEGLWELVRSFKGVMFPAHIDKTANSLIANLGFIPADRKFVTAEVKDLKNLHRLRRTEPGLLVGAGTVVTATQVREAAGAGAQFIVSPGLDEAIVQAAQTAGLAVYPGAVTATELQAAQRLGLGVVKFFPAAQSGGPAAIRAFHGPFPGLRLLPTGGVTLENLAAYLRCPAVLACGGSFLAPADVLARGGWAAVIRLCRQARAIAEEVSNG